MTALPWPRSRGHWKRERRGEQDTACGGPVKERRRALRSTKANTSTKIGVYEPQTRTGKAHTGKQRSTTQKLKRTSRRAAAGPPWTPSSTRVDRGASDGPCVLPAKPRKKRRALWYGKSRRHSSNFASRASTSLTERSLPAGLAFPLCHPLSHLTSSK